MSTTQKGNETLDITPIKAAHPLQLVRAQKLITSMSLSDLKDELSEFKSAEVGTDTPGITDRLERREILKNRLQVARQQQLESLKQNAELNVALESMERYRDW
jgi:hypothetical protein